MLGKAESGEINWRHGSESKFELPPFPLANCLVEFVIFLGLYLGQSVLRLHDLDSCLRWVHKHGNKQSEWRAGETAHPKAQYSHLHLLAQLRVHIPVPLFHFPQCVNLPLKLTDLRLEIKDLVVTLVPCKIELV
jgi:hypothetical protein